MEDNNYCELTLDYFNDLLPEKEKREFEQHLLECDECREELKELAMLTEDLPYFSEPASPPSGMKERILANVLEENTQKEDIRAETPKKPGPTNPPRKRSWILPAMAAALFLSLIGNAWLINQKNDTQNLALENQVGLAATQSGSSMTATASLLKNENDNQLVLQAENLKGLSKGEIYQVWLLENNKPYPAGYFVPDKSGKGTVLYTIPEGSKHKWDTVAITIENQKNQPSPKGQVLLAGKI
ncbi:anti-sigma factor [Metabacillus sp. GX 13764]|uniref:anti-sigma factor n=1 Tax=Metabacillus kandeliae TaxID=2900151 RepID=UPI001E615D55|nr:anti-sigma factor [Metabacillus kandeliae]MCD7034795.1 anti-sigma factor [Metabacillus kandeliae]